MPAATRPALAGLTAAVAALALAVGAGGAGALPVVAVSAHRNGPLHAPPTDVSALLPPAGGIFTGSSAGPVGPFAAAVGKHPAIYGEFVHWGQSIHFAFTHAADAHARLMLHIQTYAGRGPEAVTPLEIAHGAGDAYLIGLNRLIAGSGHPVYVRLLPEMNQANNPYCAFTASGASRGPAFSTGAFIAAWRRTVTILRGGDVSAIDAALAALHQPRLHGITADAALPAPPVSFVWTPQVAGSPDTPANSAAAYYPGDAYVDWVGTDFYSKFPNFKGLEAFYRQFPQKPFAFGEWAIWDGDNPAWVNQLFSWVSAHRRVRMMLYNQGFGAFALSADPGSSSAIRHQLASPRYLAYTPDWR